MSNEQAGMTDRQLELFADVLGEADSAFHKFAFSEMLMHGNPDRVVLKLAVMATMAMWAFKTAEKDNTTIEEQMRAAGGMVSEILSKIGPDEMKTFGCAKIKSIHESFQAMREARTANTH